MKLPSLGHKKLIRVLKKIGFEEARQTGSHLILLNQESKKIIPVPIHNKDIKKGLLAGIIKKSKISIYLNLIAFFAIPVLFALIVKSF